VPNFVSVATSVAELAHGDKLCTQAITHSFTNSPSLFDAPGTEAFALECMCRSILSVGWCPGRSHCWAGELDILPVIHANCGSS